MKIYFVRHSEVIKKYQGCYNGHIDIPLSKKGRKDAKKLAQKLSHIKFDKIFCSDLLRARETLEAFDLECEIIYTDRLREKSWGKYEGMRFEEIIKEGVEYRNFTQWINDLDGEDFWSYSGRLLEYFKNTLLKQEKKNMLVVTHAGVIKTLLFLTKEISLDEAFALSLPYSSCIVYDVQKRDWV